MLHRLCLLALIPAVMAAGPAFAGEAEDAAAPLATGSAATDDQIAAYLRDLPPATSPAPSAEAFGAYAPFDDRRPHGEVSVAIGNHGYRSLYARQTLPVGQTGTLDIAVQHDSFKGRRGGRYGGTGLALSLDFSGREDACAAAAPWRREPILLSDCGRLPGDVYRAR